MLMTGIDMRKLYAMSRVKKVEMRSIGSGIIGAEFERNAKLVIQVS
jgi:hypothetical protein